MNRVIISTSEYNELRDFKNGIEKYGVVRIIEPNSYYGKRDISYITKEEGIIELKEITNKLIEENNKLVKENYDLNRIKSLSVREFRRYKKNNKNIL